MKEFGINFVDESNIKPGSAPIEVIGANVIPIDLFKRHGVSIIYLVEFPGNMYGVYLRSSVNLEEPAGSGLKQNPEPATTVGTFKLIPDIQEPAEEIVETEIEEVVERKTVEESVVEEVIEKEGKWVRIFPQMIFPNRRVRCKSGSDAGRTAIIRNVVRPGAPDSETTVLATKGETVTSYTSDEGETVSNSSQAQEALKKMTMVGMFAKPDNVTIEWEEPKEETTTQSTEVEGFRLSSREVNAPLTHSNLTKARLCSDFLIWSLDI